MADDLERELKEKFEAGAKAKREQKEREDQASQTARGNADAAAAAASRLMTEVIQPAIETASKALGLKGVGPRTIDMREGVSTPEQRTADGGRKCIAALARPHNWEVQIACGIALAKGESFAFSLGTPTKNFPADAPAADIRDYLNSRLKEIATKYGAL